MQIVTTFDPATATTNTFKVPQSAASGSMVIWNESNISLSIQFQTGDSAYIPAWGARRFVGSYGGSTITWAQQAQLASNQAPLSQVIVETYAQGEDLHEVFPMTLSRQTNVGNASTVTSAASSVQNDGNVAGTSVVEATVAGDPNSAVQITNAGIVTFGSAAHHGSVTTIGGGFTGVGILSTGGLTVSGGGTALDGGAITTDNSGHLTTTGTLTAAQMLFAKGSISRIAQAGPFTLSTTTKTAENHGLGAVPDLALAILDTDSIAGSQVLIDYSSFTSTQVSCKAVGIGSGSAVFFLLTIKF